MLSLNGSLKSLTVASFLAEIAIGGLALPCKAAELAGVIMPDQVLVGKKKLVLNGMGKVTATIFHVKVYVSALYLEKTSHQAGPIIHSNELKKIKIKFLHDVSAEDSRKAWQTTLQDNCMQGCDKLDKRIAELNSHVTDAKEGDTNDYTFYPDHFEIEVNGVKKASLTGADFTQNVLATWIGPHPTSSDQREALLGVSGD